MGRTSPHVDGIMRKRKKKTSSPTLPTTASWSQKKILLAQALGYSKGKAPRVPKDFENILGKWPHWEMTTPYKQLVQTRVTSLNYYFTAHILHFLTYEPRHPAR